jgi:Cyclic nucleotide-binding domain
VIYYPESITVERLGKHESFGEISFLDGRAASASVIADGPVTLLEMEGWYLNKVLRKEENQPTAMRFACFLFEVIGRRFVEEQNRVPRRPQPPKPLSRPQIQAFECSGGESTATTATTSSAVEDGPDPGQPCLSRSDGNNNYCPSSCSKAEELGRPSLSDSDDGESGSAHSKASKRKGHGLYS